MTAAGVLPCAGEPTHDGGIMIADPARAEDLARSWRRDLQAWAIPDEILAQAEESPWGHPVAMFEAPDAIPDSPSHARAREALPPEGTVLDVGCGGGRAGLALVPGPSTIIGVDESENMLASFRAACERRQVAHVEVPGRWPDVDAPNADVVVCHHVLFNVPDIVPFLIALDAHARRRVVIEIPWQHPQSPWNELWQEFWGLTRPTVPVAGDVVEIARALGFAPQAERWSDPTWGARVRLPDEERARYARIRLCLSSDREAEVAAALRPESSPRDMLTISWDHGPGPSIVSRRDSP